MKRESDIQIDACMYLAIIANRCLDHRRVRLWNCNAQLKKNNNNRCFKRGYQYSFKDYSKVETTIKEQSEEVEHLVKVNNNNNKTF
jgi:exonuclease VII large subunit